ncbi:GNAT family N-acetyltransferase [Falsibacillus pallidus]|uniref:GNAT family N-acetyltransferase n=1 Tax=Falsibacillus pallidus TaxID=493781 RepID=UPI003D958C12
MKSNELFAETQRLIIRPFKKEDYEEWRKGFDKRKPSQYKYDDGFREMPHATKDWFEKWIAGFKESAERDEMYHLGIFRKEDGANVGKVEFVRILRMDYHWAMMGYSLHNQFWKRGYGVESVEAARKIFFDTLGYHRIELHIRPDNFPSIRLAERVGFQFECIRKGFSMEDGKWTDYSIYYKNND